MDIQRMLDRYVDTGNRMVACRHTRRHQSEARMTKSIHGKGKTYTDLVFPTRLANILLPQLHVLIIGK